MDAESKGGDETSFREAARAVGELFRSVRKLRALFKGKPLPEWLQPPVGYEVGIPTTESPGSGSWIMEVAEVDLADGVQPLLARAFEDSRDPKWDDDEESECKVWVDTRESSSAGSPLRVVLGSALIGTLDGEYAFALQRELQNAQRRRQPLVLEASIERKRGQFSLCVVVPPDTRPRL
jgi:hypothetical protein